MRKIAMLTSGGDAPGMNAAIRAVLRCGITAGMEVYGVERGYNGLLDGDINKMDWTQGGSIIYRGGTILKSARCKEFFIDEYIDKAADNLKKLGITDLVVIGGNGSYAGAAELHKRGINVIGIPATIDNDLAYTDFTIGFDTSVNTVVDIITKVRDTSSSHERVTIIEVMGRECGDIALHAGVSGGADIILIPEHDMPLQEVVDKIRSRKEAGMVHSIVVKAEGVDIPLEEMRVLVETLTGQETRIVDPGCIQRGGSPTASDRMLASLLGAKAIEVIGSHSPDDSYAVALGTKNSQIAISDLDAALMVQHKLDPDIYNLTKVL